MKIKFYNKWEYSLKIGLLEIERFTNPKGIAITILGFGFIKSL